MLDTTTEVCQDAHIVKTAPTEAVVRLSKPLATKLGRPRTIHGSPWDDQGVSKATYYRRIKPALPTQISYAAEPIRWFCAVTEYGAEKAVNDAVNAAGFETFYPLKCIPPVAAHRTSSGRAIQATSERLIALLPHYLLIRFDRSDVSWRQIASMRGVERIIGTSPEWPTPIPDAQISKMRQQLGADDVYRETTAVMVDDGKKRWTDMATALLRFVETSDG